MHKAHFNINSMNLLNWIRKQLGLLTANDKSNSKGQRDKETKGEKTAAPGLEILIKQEKEVMDSPLARPKKEIFKISSQAAYLFEILENYIYPRLDLLGDITEISINREILEKQKNIIISGLRSFNIELLRLSATVGPTITLFEITPADERIKGGQIIRLNQDIARLLHKAYVKVYSLSERGTIAIEIPNEDYHIVQIRDILCRSSFIEAEMKLPLALGKKMNNESFIVDLAVINHLLIGGATGQGKSALLDSIILSLLYKKHPSQLKLILIGTNKISFAVYEKLKNHFLAKNADSDSTVIEDSFNAVETLSCLCIEMDSRYELLSHAQVRNWDDYNKKFVTQTLGNVKGVIFVYLPALVLIVDELADIMQFDRSVEIYLIKLAQKSRLVGIHLILSTQRASAKIITNAIKENFLTRIGFKVPSKIDSSILLDNDMASQISRVGEAIYQNNNENIKIQCSFAEIEEIENATLFISSQKGYNSIFELPEVNPYIVQRKEEAERDRMFNECAKMIVNSQSGSPSMLQRKFNFGFNRANRIMDQLEAAGIVGRASGRRPRDVLISTESELDRYLEGLTK